jgi:hypothetical protein
MNRRGILKWLFGMAAAAVGLPLAKAEPKVAKAEPLAKTKSEPGGRPKTMKEKLELLRKADKLAAKEPPVLVHNRPFPKDWWNPEYYKKVDDYIQNMTSS